MGWDYSEKTKQIFMDAVQGKPGTHMGEIEDPDGFGEHGSIACGDALRFTFRVERDPTDPLRDTVVEARYLTFGCTSAIAASEALCVLIEQKRCTPIEALRITNQDIVDFLDGLPEQKIHCSVMGAEALEAAVYNWSQKRGVELRDLGIDLHPHEQDEGRIVCKCFNMTETYIRRKISELNLRTIPEITGAIKAGGACMSCHHVPGGLQDLLDEVWGRKPLALKDAPEQLESREPAGATLTPFQFSKQVERALEDHIRPMLRKDGGDIDLVDISEQIVYVRLAGACAGCFGAGMTMKLIVEKTLKDRVDERIRVVTVES